MLKLPLYARTVRHLTWRQIAYRVIRRMQRRIPPRHHHRIEPALGDQARMAAVLVGVGSGDAPQRLPVADAVCRGEFSFLNTSRTLERIDWRTRYVSHLWSYNLHYFDYALDLAWAHRLTGAEQYVSRFVQLASDWITDTKDGTGDGWEPYAISVRVLNWSRALVLFGDSISPAAKTRLLLSLYDQVAFLRRRLERDLLANHLHKNLVAICIGCLMFEGATPREWRRRAMSELWRQLDVQVLADGGHFERSPMYHTVVLADSLECAQLLRACGEDVPASVGETLRKMAAAYSVLSRADGRIHLFNDSAYGIGPSKRSLGDLVKAETGASLAFPAGALELKATGYYGFSATDGTTRLLIDCGPPAADVQPGHAHCDALSFELDLNGEQVIVDSGVSGYEGDPLREYVRSTRAHNTLMINGQEQSEVWGTFRLARRITGTTATQTLSGDEYRFAGSYIPYHDERLSHQRLITADATGVVVTDRVDGPGIKRVQSFIHFHPAFAVHAEGNMLVAVSASQQVIIATFGGVQIEIARGTANPPQGWYCPEFGSAIQAFVAILSKADGEAFGYRITSMSAGQR